MQAIIPESGSQRAGALHGRAPLAESPDRALAALVTLTARMCDAPAALLTVLTGAEESCKAAHGLAQAFRARGRSLAARTLADALTVVRDVRDDEQLQSHPLFAGDSEWRFFAAAPLYAADGRLIGSLCVLDRRQRDLEGRQREALVGLARQAVALLELQRSLSLLNDEALEREHAQRALAESEADFRLLADTLPHLVWTCRADGTLVYANRRALEHFGTSFAELRERFGEASILHPEDRERVLVAWRQALRTRRPLNVEGRLYRHDGTFRWHLLRAQPVTDVAGRVLHWMGTSTDVHDARETNERSAFLLALSTELARISNPQELVCTAMLRLRQRLGTERVTLAELDEEQNEIVLLRQCAGDEARIEVASLSLEPFQELSRGARQGQTTAIADTRRDPRTAQLYERWFRPRGVEAIVSAPLLHGGRLVALLSAIAARPHAWTAAEIELLERVAEIVWPALVKARADRELAVSEERLRLAQGIAEIGTWQLEPDSHKAFYSEESRALFGLDPREPPLYEQWLRRVDAADRARVEQALGECVRSGAAELEYRYRHPQRGLRWIYGKAAMVTYAGQRSMVGISLDVTERRQAEETLREINQRKDEFLAMLAHELRNPLAPIRNAAQILRVHAAGRPELDWARSVIERQTRHLVRLVDDLLDVSRIVRGQIVLQYAPIDLEDLVRHAVETSRPLIRARRHRLKVRLPAEPVRLEGDLTRLAQVIGNLLHNAAKYTEEAGQIWLEADVEDREVAIRVRDTGLGIPAELLPRIFDLFTQAERTLDRAEGGLGIGLTLVKRLVEMHGGTVEAHSAGLGQGAEFVVRLPLPAPAHAKEGRDVQGGSQTPGARPLQVLVVDDNVDAADSIAMLLELEGHHARSVHSAHEALAAAADHMPDVVLLDIGLPEMDGYELARKLRELAAGREVRLIAVTGYGQPEDRERSRAAGFDEHLVKPVEPAALMEVLRPPVSPNER